MCQRAIPQRVALGRNSSSRCRSSRVPALRCSSAATGGGRPLPASPLLRLASTAAALVQRCVSATRTAVTQAAAQMAEQDLEAQMKVALKQMRMLTLVAPFAAVSGSTDTFMIITRAVASFIKLYLLLLFVRVLLSWFPTFQWWEQQPFSALRQVTDPYLKLFSGLVPPLLGSIDLTPLFGFFILQFLAGALDVADDETRYW
ncbi:hypothetical protein D9Q98_004959 [Chlorella vulgaris]|uniref:Fanciful K+ uptake-b family transporter n=2 Tax=Chlorella TaxID=3071 RepID=A0A9D4YX86_CHLVU|nr:hypothetical protein D9Q98_004959 [Chlorella vulgaris]